MNSKAISCRILSCLLLALLLQYADAKKSHYLESILESLQRIEGMLVKHAEQNALNCLVPAEQLYSLLSEHQTLSNESNEIISNEPNSEIRKALDFHDFQHILIPKKLKHHRKNRNRNENVNTNINENVNTNTNANRHHRRSFVDIDPRSFKEHNRNMNSNYNLNSNLQEHSNKNREDIFDFTDEDDEVN